MARFRFGLEPLLELRRRTVRQKQAQLARTAQRSRRRRSFEVACGRQPALEAFCKRPDRADEDAALTRYRTELIEATNAAGALERLRERRFRRFREEALRKEERELEDASR